VSALLCSVVVGAIIAQVDQNLLTGFIAVTVAAMYVQVGILAAAGRNWCRALVLGVCLGATAEWVVVAGDYFFSLGLMPNVTESAVRGTFRGKNQLGNYGYSVMGLLLSLGWVLFPAGRTRTLVLSGGLFAFFFPVAAVRRAIILVGGPWLILASVGAVKKSYFAVALGIIILLITGVMGGALYGLGLELLPESDMVRRLKNAIDQLDSEDSFITYQAATVLAHAADWLPFGVGWGRGVRYDPYGIYEIHNGQLALAVEGGLAAMISFDLLIAYAAWSLWQVTSRSAWSGTERARRAVRLLGTTYLLAAYPLMYHHLLHRERGFMLLLGTLIGLLLTTRRKPRHRPSRPWRGLARDLQSPPWVEKEAAVRSRAHARIGLR